MTQQELTLLNLGTSLDNLMNLDPRGYGVCNLLYSASRELAGEPVSSHAAKFLQSKIKPGDYVFIIVGFVLHPYKCAETDGIIGAMLLARSLYLSLGCKPVILCQEENVPAVIGLSRLLGMQAFSGVQAMGDIPVSLCYYPISKDKTEAKKQGKQIMEDIKGSCVITIEAPGANEVGVYHNAIGLEITELEAKMDVIFQDMMDAGIPSLSIGDLGNEMGMGTLKEKIVGKVPYLGKGECSCGCGGGILANTSADEVLTATTSDWGCYAISAMLAYLTNNLNVFHTKELQAQAMQKAADCGMIDMYGWSIPAIDGIGLELNCAIVESMRECVSNTMNLKDTCKKWFDKTLELGAFEGKK